MHSSKKSFVSGAAVRTASADGHGRRSFLGMLGRVLAASAVLPLLPTGVSARLIGDVGASPPEEWVPDNALCD